MLLDGILSENSHLISVAGDEFVEWFLVLHDGSFDLRHSEEILEFFLQGSELRVNNGCRIIFCKLVFEVPHSEFKGTNI